jgi:hypothetical protein
MNLTFVHQKRSRYQKGTCQFKLEKFTVFKNIIVKYSKRMIVEKVGMELRKEIGGYPR